MSEDQKNVDDVVEKAEEVAAEAEAASEKAEEVAEEAEKVAEAAEQVAQDADAAAEDEEAAADEEPEDEADEADDDIDAAADEPADEDAAVDPNPNDTADLTSVMEAAPAPRKGLGTPAWLCICVAALVLGLLAGHFLISGTSSGSTISLDGRTSISAAELDATIASYTFNGKTVNITSRDVLTQYATIDASANDDGTYTVPVAEDIATYARTQIMVDYANAQGLEVSNEDVDEYVESYMSSDVATVAEGYGIDEETLYKVLGQNLLISSLREQVSTVEVPDAPTEPTYPEDGDEDTASADYATYIIDLVGDEWDSETGTWATTDGDYYATLSSYEITNDSATYAAAEAAYNVAYTKYYTAYTESASEWMTYYNSILADASIQIGTLAMSTSSSY